MARNPLQTGDDSGNPLSLAPWQIGDPTDPMVPAGAQTGVAGVDALGAWLAEQRAKSAQMGMWNDQTGLPTKAGLLDAIGQAGTAVALGTNSRPVPPAFRSWFSASKVATPEGMPLQVYHGTNSPGYETYDPAMAGTKTGNVTTPLGHFFTDQPTEASRYATGWGSEGANVRPVYLSLQNPYKMTPKEFDDLAMSVFRGQKTEPEALDHSLALRNSLIEQGHDGIVIPGRGMRPTEYVAFHPHQIAPAMNVDAAAP